MNDEQTFLRAIADKPDDETLRLIFADWLEERGDWRAEFVRLDCTLPGPEPTDQTEAHARWRELRARLDPLWLALLDRSPVENCDFRFRFRCPKHWDELNPTALPTVRFCDSCRKDVFYCPTVDEAREHARAGRCVAVNAGAARRPGDLESEDLRGRLMGVIDPYPFEPEPLPEDPPAKKPWWKFW